MTVADLLKLNNLPLAGRLLSDELGLGLHASRRVGAGVEFEQYRNYAPGDDPRQVDWKLFARTERYVVRESAAESQQSVRLLLDGSGSMNYAEGNVTRLAYAKLMLASLAYVAHRQGDPLSLYVFRHGQLEPLVSPGARAFQRVLSRLERAEAAGPWQNEQPQFPALWTKQRELLIMVSDFLQVNDEWLNVVKALVGPRRNVALLQLLGDDEIDFSLTGFYRFRDLETGQEVEVQVERTRTAFREAAATYLRALDDALRLPHVRLVRARLSEPPALVLRRLVSEVNTL